MEHSLIDQLEKNARLWELRAARVSNPKTRVLLNRRATRGRELAERLRKEAAQGCFSTPRPCHAPTTPGGVSMTVQEKVGTFVTARAQPAVCDLPEDPASQSCFSAIGPYPGPTTARAVSMTLQEKVRIFVTARGQRAVCDDCIADYLALGRRQVSSAHATLKRQGVIQRRSGQCSGCWTARSLTVPIVD